MAKGCRGSRRVASRQARHAPYLLPNCKVHPSVGVCGNKCPKALSNDWEDATCSVCMECPHNAVLLLCSSHDKGCRPYMCGTSFRFSSCLDQYKKAYTKVASNDNEPSEKCKMTALACPLCRGQVKGWVVAEPARKHLNSKQRSCMQDGCSFTGTYKELRRHVRSEHPSACPWEVDSFAEQKWRRLEREREHDDVISAIRSSIRGADNGVVAVGNNEGSGAFGVGFDDSSMVNIITYLRILIPNSRRLIRASGGSQTSEDGSVHSLNTVYEDTTRDMRAAEVLTNGRAATVHDTSSEQIRHRHRYLQ